MNRIYTKEHILKNKTTYIKNERYHINKNTQGVYILILKDEIRYIGISKDVKKRIQTHAILSWVSSVFDSYFVVPTFFDNRDDLLEIERQYINELNPVKNSHRPDFNKNYELI